MNQARKFNVVFVIGCLLVGLSDSSAHIPSLPDTTVAPQPRMVPRSKEIRSINIASGYPLTSSFDVTGGFGDVAANFIAALELKKRRPNVEINLIVTTPTDEKRSGVISSDRIITTLAPSLNPERLYERQVFAGISVYFTKARTDEYLFRGSSEFAKLPQADLGLQFSANSSGARGLLIDSSRHVIDFYEYEHPTTLAVSRGANNRKDFDSTGLRIRSHSAGLFLDGMYLTQFDDSESARLHRLRIIENWIRSERPPYATLSLSDADLAVAYSGQQDELRGYLQAIVEEAKSRLKPVGAGGGDSESKGKPIIVIVRDMDSVRQLRDIPPNLTIIPVTQFRYENFEAAAIESTIPPLLTGDNSFSVGLSATRNGRFFVYEVRSWKGNFAAHFTDELLKRIPAEKLTDQQRELFRKVMKYQSLSQLPAAELRRFMFDVEMQKTLSAAVQSQLPRSDLFENVFRIVDLEQWLELESRAGLIDNQLFDILKRIAIDSNSPENFISEVRREFDTMVEKARRHEEIDPVRYVTLLSVLAKAEYFATRQVELLAILRKLRFQPEALGVFIKFAQADRTGWIAKFLGDTQVRTEIEGLAAGSGRSGPRDVRVPPAAKSIGTCRDLF